MDEFGEGIGNPFDTPIPGQSLTDEPGNYPWEHPATYVTTDGAADHLWNRMSEPEFAEQIIAMLDAGVPGAGMSGATSVAPTTDTPLCLALPLCLC